jgi:hypothetical protein
MSIELNHREFMEVVFVTESVVAVSVASTS